eukprot:232494-Alexandrium_andersonii.AAC.1
MSASLVGSEMCIRDRSQPTQGPKGPLRDSESAKAGDPPASLSGAGGAAPVSYTHLTLPTICSV